VLAVVCLFAGGCAATGALNRGRSAGLRQDYDIAVVEYTKALRLRPNDSDARLALDRAKIRAAQDHFMRGRRLAATGKLDRALVEFELASELNPSGGDIDDELRSTRNKLRAKIAVAREGKTELQTIIDRSRDPPPPGMDLPAGVKMPASLTFRDASSRDVFMTIARFANISLIFDGVSRGRRSASTCATRRSRTRSAQWPVRHARSSGSPRRKPLSSFRTRRRNAASTRKRSSARSI
jgi:tetratricopeptide (TPR) repeat protein